MKRCSNRPLKLTLCFQRQKVRFPAAVQHGAKRSGALLIRDRRSLRVRDDPGSAAHHFVLRCARETVRKKLKKKN
jgi:hypothetical protein